jgi:hypothetical protein
MPIRSRTFGHALYGKPSAMNEVLIVNGEPYPGRTRVLLLRQAIGY